MHWYLFFLVSMLREGDWTSLLFFILMSDVLKTRKILQTCSVKQISNDTFIYYQRFDSHLLLRFYLYLEEVLIYLRISKIGINTPPTALFRSIFYSILTDQRVNDK